MFADDQLLPISALQHWLYCPRQCALIHVERAWAENRFTVEGRHLHARADAGRAESRDGVRTTRALSLCSYALGLVGKADVVEFRTVPSTVRPEPVEGRHTAAATNNSQRATVQPFPIEYKRGKPKAHDADRVQLCAQALCLEETFGGAVPDGALFYGKTRRRHDVVFDDGLRELTRRTAAELHELLDSGRTPAAEYEKKKCGVCSLIDLCLPRVPAGRAARYLDRAVAAAITSGGPESD